MMEKRTHPDEWIPVNGLKLEANALIAAKSKSNYLVVAGPGAGKTELLAQRACYLLQTNGCPYPQKILAISFKSDAARNLQERVNERLGKELSHRFKSLTFDAFAKGLIDRFRNGIPEAYRPNRDYDIMFKAVPLLECYDEVKPGLSKNANEGKLVSCITQTSYPIDTKSVNADIVLNALLKLIKEKNLLSFPVISRLAEYLFNNNPQLLSLLRQTYSHVFLDEFQDTTSLQYALLKKCFQGSDSVVTAVGDHKQRIMVWAGAMQEIFTAFQKDFTAAPLLLNMNFRSAPRLVRLMNHLVVELMNEPSNILPHPDKDPNSGEAKMLTFRDPQHEARELAKIIHELVKKDGIPEREICVLVKQTPLKYSEDLIHELNSQGTGCRIENDFQDLLTEPIITFLIEYASLIVNPSQSSGRNTIMDAYASLFNLVEDLDLLLFEKELLSSIKEKRKRLEGTSDFSLIEKELREVIADISYEVFQRVYKQYNQRKYFEGLINKFFAKLKMYYNESKDLKTALTRFRGVNSIPIMTIHKSKGLEFKVVFFVGFEDSAFWSFTKQPAEDTCTFFVALSRAKEKVFFTFSKTRKGRYNRNTVQHKGNIASLENALIESGLVDEVDYS